MTPHDRQNRLVDQLRLFEDPQERLAFIQERARKAPPLAEEFRTEAHRVSGCATRVWIRCTSEGAVCTFEVDSESSMVRGLALLVCEVYSGCAATDITGFTCTLPALAGLDRVVTPTRLHGLSKVQEVIRGFAHSVTADSSPARNPSPAL
jgi:cysteine desulfuration protein SufE